jgi:hypothetical protein
LSTPRISFVSARIQAPRRLRRDFLGPGLRPAIQLRLDSRVRSQLRAKTASKHTPSIRYAHFGVPRAQILSQLRPYTTIAYDKISCELKLFPAPFLLAQYDRLAKASTVYTREERLTGVKDQ